jgi:drug/metabolite transporter (DMT)-like permease
MLAAPMARHRIAYLALAAAAFLFGATFVLVKEAVGRMPPIGFVGWRFLLGALALLAISPPRRSVLWRDGAIAGLLLFGGYALQTQGLVSTSASNSGLITGLYVVVTPLLAALVTRRLPRAWVMTGAVIAFAGFAALTIGGDFRLQEGDLLTVGCAISYAAHIVYLSKAALRHRVLPFTAVQLLVTAILGLAWSAAAEGFPIPDRHTWPAIVITGLAVSAGAFLLQIWSQTVIGASRTAIILALEPAFAAGTAMVVLGERLDARGWLGAVLILAGIYVVLATEGDEDELPIAESLTPAH